jgi:uncharacterized protein Yka (UPF0111/DUF47 family)
MAEQPKTAIGLDVNRSKQEILQNLGEFSLVLPLLVNRGLEANDRAKYLLALMQAARHHADQPDRPFSSLSEERLAAGVTDERLDGVVAGARPAGADAYMIPGVGGLHGDLVAAIKDMLAPLEVAGGGVGRSAERLETLLAEMPDLSADCIPGTYLDGIASADRQSGDTLHILIMDAHRALNQLQTEVATEMLDGASVYCLEEDDRQLVSAFMAGVRATQSLKFDHPGLGTTATRVGSRLLIQNDIGMTNAHVIVVTVDGLVSTVTYTDVHLERLSFFESMLDRFPVQWSDAQYRDGTGSLGQHHLVTGSYESPDRESLEAYLSYLGSRLVFLIDWNRARKRLGSLVKKKEAIELLQWAAEEGLGHMAFLLMGAERLVYDAIGLTDRVPVRYGEPLREVLGVEATLDVLRFAIRTASEGMLSGKSQLLIRDELRVELMKHVQATDRQLLDSAAEHGSLVVEAAQAVRAALVHLGLSDGGGFLRRAADRARSWEHRADEILTAIRLAAHRTDGADAMVWIVSSLDDAMDNLEETLFLLTLLPDDASAAVRPILVPLAGIAVSASREHLKALEIAKGLVVAASDDELEDFLVAVNRVAVLEHEADVAERTARAMLVTEAPDFRSLHVADQISRSTEDATDALARSALLLRDHVLGLMNLR